MDRKKATSLGDAADSPLSEGLQYARACSAWDAAVGDAVSRLTLSKRLDGGTFTVRLNSSVLRMQLEMNKETIRARMNETLGSDSITKIVLR